VKDGALTVACGPTVHVTCATMPSTRSSRSTSRTAQNTRFEALPPLTSPNIGDELVGEGVDWAWYSAGWSKPTVMSELRLDER